MARRRGLSTPERLALDLATITATATIVSAPCFLYSAVFSLLNTNVTGIADLADTSASGDAYIELNRISVTFGSLGASGGANQPVVMNFNPPIYVAKTLALGTTGVKVSVTYLAAS